MMLSLVIALAAAGQQPAEAQLRDRSRIFSQCADAAVDELVAGPETDRAVAQAAMTRCRAELAEVQTALYAVASDSGPGGADQIWEDNLARIRTGLTRRAAERRARRP